MLNAALGRFQKSSSRPQSLHRTPCTLLWRNHGARHGRIKVRPQIAVLLYAAAPSALRSPSFWREFGLRRSYPQQLTGICGLDSGRLEPPRGGGIATSVSLRKREDLMGQIDRLPSQFPDGTRFVIEGRAGRIVSRYLEFPDGRHVDLTTDHPGSGGRVRERQRLRKTAALASAK
jgi:hypothetical protein